MGVCDDKMSASSSGDNTQLGRVKVKNSSDVGT